MKTPIHEQLGAGIVLAKYCGAVKALGSRVRHIARDCHSHSMSAFVIFRDIWSAILKIAKVNYWTMRLTHYISGGASSLYTTI
jgi:hypothetical protein